ncbi:MAG: MCP four helix bundle domain-containing protein [Rhodoferax sp.]|nr:MCP four helix bundle domain-containing protein [Rhodoferax sp.]
MNKLKISTRLMILIGVLSALLLGIGSVGLYGISKSNDALKSVYEDRTVPLEQLADIDYLMVRNRVLVRDMLLQPAAENVEKRNRELRGNAEKVSKTWEAYMATYLTPEEKKLADAFTQARKTYVQEGIFPTTEAVLPANSSALSIYKSKISPSGTSRARRNHPLDPVASR